MHNSVSMYLNDTLKRYSDKIAIKDDSNQITFKELDDMSSAIAYKLISMNYFNKPILVLTSRTVLTPVCHVGIARSGCFYVPMDSTNPSSRLQQIIDIVCADLLIVDLKNIELLKSVKYEGFVLVLEDIIKSEYDKELVHKVETTVVNTMPLYVIFTSGSTGIPKGVTTSHLSVMSYIDAIEKVIRVEHDDVIGSQSAMDYIAAVRDIYLMLKTGATLCVIPSNEFATPEKLLATLNNNNISTICWSAAGLELCVKVGLFECGIPNNIRTVLFSGSVLSARALMQWQDALPNALFVNQYGPTEATASCTYHIVSEHADSETVLPIGVAYDNYHVFLLDGDSSVKDGEIGEICVSGPTIFLGYYNNEEATYKVCVQNPLNNCYKETIYRTGDLGKYNDNGELEYYGRIDRQIKHMGHRIELEEIECLGKSIEGVVECVSIYVNSNLIFIYAGDVKVKDLAVFFRKKLPNYMVPRKIKKVDSLAKLPNGKVDVKKIEKEYL